MPALDRNFPNFCLALLVRFAIANGIVCVSQWQFLQFSTSTLPLIHVQNTHNSHILDNHHTYVILVLYVLLVFFKFILCVHSKLKTSSISYYLTNEIKAYFNIVSRRHFCRPVKILVTPRIKFCRPMKIN